MTGTIVQKYINALYVVMYDRAADSNGYNYWLSTVTGATSQTPVTDAIAQTMAGSFRSASSTYFNTQYSALSDSNFILALYANLGNTSSGVGGDALNYWQGRLDGFGGDRAKLAGDFTKAFLEYNGTDAAGLLRKAAFENKVAVSQAWVDASRTNAFMNSAAPTDAAFAAQMRIIDGVDHTAAALQLVNAQVNSVVATGNLANATGVPVANPVITLTAGTIRRIRRIQKPAKEKRPSRRFLRRIPVMRKPEMTKKTSTLPRRSQLCHLRKSSTGNACAPSWTL